MFTAKGADFGTEILAANAILLQIQFIMAYCLDGFANATSIVVGRAVGSNNESLYNKGLSLTTYWGLIAVCFLSLCYLFMDNALFSLFTNDMSTIEAAKEYSFWLTLFPLLQVLVCFFTVFSQEQQEQNQFEILLFLHSFSF
jgi:MATE family multidrug resistance protein